MSHIRNKILASLTCAAALFATTPAFAEGYVGIMGGWGFPLAIDNIKSEPVVGATVGYKFLPEMSLAATWQHDYFKTDPGSLDFGVTQWLGEANFFSFFGLNGGLHAGIAKYDLLGVSDSDLAFGAHLGQDFLIAPAISLGISGYYSYVSANDPFSIVNVMVPLKFMF
jgi:hypothetical protein